MTFLLFSLLLCCIPLLKANNIPEYYKIQANNINFSQTTMEFEGKYIPAVTMGSDSIKLKKQFREQQISRADKECGFVIKRIGVSQDLTSDTYWQKSQPATKLNMLLTKGEFRSAAFALHNLSTAKSYSIELSDMTAENGNIIAKENFDIRYVRNVKVHNSASDSFIEGRYLIKSFPVNIPTGNALWLWLTLHAPAKTQAGVYRGNLLIRNPKSNRTIPVVLRVVNINFSYPAGNWGMYMPGHLNQRSCGMYRNYSPPWWNDKNLKTIFTFWRTRGLNSPSFYLPYPNLNYSVNTVEASFKVLNKIVSAVRQSYLNGVICIDVRPIEFWAHAVKVFKGEKTNILGYHGTHTRVTRKPYENTDKKVFSFAIKQLIKNAQKNNWGKILLLPEEELCSTRWVDKPAGYEAFMPALKKVAGPDKVMLVDNTVGYPSYDYDTGAKDKIMTRQYNSWTQKSLNAAKEDNASVWAFNYGFSRPSWGLLLQRLKASGNHQWAEAWEFYQFAIPVNNKIIPSIQYERMREGLCDLAIFRMLQQLIPKVPNQKLRYKATILLDKIVKDIPCRRYPYLEWEKNIDDEQIDILRWQSIKSILELKGAKTNKKLSIQKQETTQRCRIIGQYTVPAKQETKLPKTANNHLRNKKAVAIWLEKKIKVDGQFDSEWSKATKADDRLYWTAEREAYLRRAASSESDFKRFGPLWNEWRAAYDPDGLYLLFESNLSKTFKASRKDGTPDIWRDDCIEVFWQSSGNMPVRQLLVNLSGSKTLMQNGRSLKNKIKTAVKLRKKNGLSCFIEIFIPWKDCGITKIPSPGTCWNFNLGMEYHSGQQMLIWSQVKRRFGLSKGKLIFSFPETNKFKILSFKPGNSFYGINKLQLNVESKIKLKAELFNAQRKLQWSNNIKDGWLVKNYAIPNIDKPEKWILEIKNLAGKTILSLPILVPANKEKLNFIKVPEKIFSNSNISIEFEAKVGEISAQTLPLNIRLVNSNNKRIYNFNTQKLMIPSKQLMQLRIGNIPEGKYLLQISIDHFRSFAVRKIYVYENFL